MKQMFLLLILYGMNAVVFGQNMNGEYIVASGSNQNVNFNTDYSSKGNEYFDIYSPEIATKYGDVFWMSQGVIDLPDDIIQRFAGKVIAITGYEQDQVMVQPTGEPGVNPDKDVSVPINWAYNHHYMLWMTGNYSTLKYVQTESIDDIWYNHGLSSKLIAVDLPSAKLRDDPDIPTNQLFSEGNGGESRKSFHGYPKGYAQLIESPQSWHLTPMQIDTRNRDCGVTIDDVNNCTQFIPGIEPLQARYGRGAPKGTNYSGLLECPCNGKFGGDPIFYGDNTLTKVVVHNFATVQLPQCINGQNVLSSTDCFSAVSNMGFERNVRIINKIITDPSMPTYCTLDQQANDTIYVYWNEADGKQQCSTSDLLIGETKSAVNVSVTLSLNTDTGNVTFVRQPSGEYCSYNHNNVLAKYPAANNSVPASSDALNKCESFCATSEACTVCSVDCSLNMHADSGECQWVALPECGNILHYKGPNGLLIGDVSFKNKGIVNITVSGPSNVWFGVGFNAHEMADSPWTLIVNSSGVIEQKIGTCGSEAEHCPGYTLNKTIRLLSNTVDGDVRTVFIQRELIGSDDRYYSFIPSQDGTIPLITAVGQSQVFAYHKNHSLATVSLIASDGNTCVCDTGANGKLCEADGSGCKTFIKNCKSAQDGGSLLAQNNPTCDSRQYSGGLQCCINKHNLLDANQVIPSSLLRYHMKFRFWFQEYIPVNGTQKPSHYNLDRIYQQTEANAGEYDVPPAYALPNQTVVGYPNWPINEPTPGTECNGTCPNGADCECIHKIHYRWVESPNKPMRLIYAGGHCHAPSCISLQLFRNDTGELLCEQLPVTGTGNVTNDKYDESGYILIPPCLWGDDEGLNPSILLPAGTPLLSIKKNNNTKMGHFGEMASWQMRGTYY